MDRAARRGRLVAEGVERRPGDAAVAVFAAIERREPDAAAAAMGAHMESASGRLERSLADG